MSQVREMRVLRIVSLTLVVVPFCALGYGRTIRVAQNAPADFATIQAAIDDANDGDTVLVAPGIYSGEGNRDLDFKGKAITVKSEAGPESCLIQCGGRQRAFSGPPEWTWIDAEYHRGFYLHADEDANSVLDGFTVTQGYMGPYSGGAIYCDHSSPTIRDCILTGNVARSGGGIAAYRSSVRVENCVIMKNTADWTGGDAGGGMALDGSSQVLNCLIAGNTATRQGGGVYCSGSHRFANCTVTGNRTGEWGLGGGISCGPGGNDISYLYNSIIWGNSAVYLGNDVDLLGAPIPFVMRLHVSNSLLGKEPKDVYDHYGRISGRWLMANPLFANDGYWDPNGTPNKPSDDFWVQGDYHLKSQAGRWDLATESWVKDEVTSPCVDAGDPNSPVGAEPFPNGGRIDMGAYGGTAQASKSPSGIHARYGGGAGEPNDPYLIYTAEQFRAIGANPDDWDRHFKLMADIDLGGGEGNDVRTIGYWRSWTDCKPFRGTFDGNGHRILHFTWRSTGQDRVGLFGYVAGASSYLKSAPTIKDLGLIEPNVQAGTGDDVGTLVGHFVNASVCGCYVEGGVVAGDKHVGGLIGGTMNCVILSSIPRLDIRNCRATAKVSGTEAVGGLIGYYGGVPWPPTLPYLSCYEISGCCAAGEITGTAQVGGLAGFVDGDRVFDCYSRSHVSGDHLVGGLIGISHAEVATCYAAGKVEGMSEAGGLIGSVTAGGVIPELELPIRTSSSFWDVAACGQPSSAAGTGKTTAEMQTARTFLDAGWDFVGESANGAADIWSISEGQDYPRLSWEQREQH